MSVLGDDAEGVARDDASGVPGVSGVPEDDAEGAVAAEHPARVMATSAVTTTPRSE
jgi:hypothetical protein